MNNRSDRCFDCKSSRVCNRMVGADKLNREVLSRINYVSVLCTNKLYA